MKTTLTAALVLGGSIVLASTGGAVAGSMITGAQIKNNTVTSADVRNQTLRVGDMSRGTVDKFRVLQGIRHVSATTTAYAGGHASVHVECPTNTYVLGGGAYFKGIDDGTQFVPSVNLEGATAFGHNPTGANDVLEVTAICAPADGNRDDGSTDPGAKNAVRR